MKPKAEFRGSLPNLECLALKARRAEESAKFTREIFPVCLAKKKQKRGAGLGRLNHQFSLPSLQCINLSTSKW